MASFANPLFLGKDYPDSCKNTFSHETEYLLTAEELEEISFDSDFFGIDPYTYTVVTTTDEGIDACHNNTSHKLWPLCVKASQLRGRLENRLYITVFVYIKPLQLREFLKFGTNWIS